MGVTTMGERPRGAWPELDQRGPPDDPPLMSVRIMSHRVVVYDPESDDDAAWFAADRDALVPVGGESA